MENMDARNNMVGGDSSKRLTHIDIAKGLGILLTVIGHCLVFSGFVGSRAFAVIYAFHMPLFFFLSGYVYKKKTPTVFFADKIRSLLFPVILYQSINLCMYGILFLIHKTGGYSTISFGGFWFLLTLLYVSVMYYAVDLLTVRIKNEKAQHIVRILTSVFFLGVGLVYAREISDTYNQPIATAFVGYFFYILGVYTRIWEQNPRHAVSKYVCGGIGIVLLIALTITIRANSRTVDMNTSRYAREWIFLPHAMMGIFGTYLLSVMISKNRILEFFGRNSLIVLLIHIPVSKTVPIIKDYLGCSNWVVLIVNTVLSIMLSWFAIKVFEKYLPFLAGKVKWDELYGK